jgi:hypothetical protein
MATPTDSALRSRVEAFVADISGLVRTAALQAVQDALSGAVPAKRGPGRPKNASAAKPPRPAKSGKRAKRDPEAVMAVAAKVHATIKAKPGQSVEEIPKGLRVTTKVLKLPIIKLLEAKVVSTKGQKRGTRYFASGSAPKSGPATKPAPESAAPKTGMAERMAKMRAARDAKRAAAK